MGTGRGGIELAIGIHMGVDGLLTGSHGLGENGVHVAIGSTGLKHRSPVDFAIGIRTRHDRTLVGIVDDRRIYLLRGRTVNIQLLARGFRARLHEVRILLGGSHPGSSRMLWTSGERVIRLTTVHPIDRRHREAQRRLLLPMIVTVHGSTLAERRTRNACRGRRDGGTDFILNRFGGICGLRPLQMGLRMRQVSRSRRVTPSQRTLLEVTLQNITSRERVSAENTHVRAITGVFL